MGGTSGFEHTSAPSAVHGEGAVVWDETNRRYSIYKGGTWREPSAFELERIREIDFVSHPERFPLSQQAPTDREQAVSCLLGLINALEKHEDDLARLEHVVGKAQNRPPLGASDGTLDGREWESARDAAKLLRQGLAAARRLAP